MKQILLMIICCSFLVAGCENTDIELALEAGIDAAKAVTLSDEAVRMMAVKASEKTDSSHVVASLNNPYGRRLHRLTGSKYSAQGFDFNFKVYLSDTVNAFAMADGTIRIYSGLMDMMNDRELMFVVGHEIGHVVKKHIKKKIMLAYAASAVRKGVASQRSMAGDIARSGLGGFAQMLLNAQFSQEEERQADDFGIFYLKENKKDISAAVSALKKLATLGSGHSFLSSHPAPDVRAGRLEKMLENPDQIGQPSFFENLIKKISRFLPDWITQFIFKKE